MLGSLQPYFSKLEDPRQKSTIALTDIIMSGLAVYQLKIPALQLLDNYRNEPLAHPNLKRLFGIQTVPSDTQLRDVLDRVPTDAFRVPFDIIFRTLQKDKALEQFKFHDGTKDQYLVATTQLESLDLPISNAIIALQRCRRVKMKMVRSYFIITNFSLLPLFILITIQLFPYVQSLSSSKTATQKMIANSQLLRGHTST